MGHNFKVCNFKKELKRMELKHLSHSYESQGNESLTYKNPEYFKREFKNPSLYSQGRYGLENRRFRDIYQ